MPLKGTPKRNSSCAPTMYPFVTVKLNGTQIIQTANKTDALTASFTEATDQQIVAGSKLELIIADNDDTSGDDQILDCVIDPLGADLLRDAIVSCTGSGGQTGSTVIIHIDAKG